jgi:hypothetical protein
VIVETLRVSGLLTPQSSLQECWYNESSRQPKHIHRHIQHEPPFTLNLCISFFRIRKNPEANRIRKLHHDANKLAKTLTVRSIDCHYTLRQATTKTLSSNIHLCQTCQSWYSLPSQPPSKFLQAAPPVFTCINKPLDSSLCGAYQDVRRKTENNPGVRVER